MEIDNESEDACKGSPSSSKHYQSHVTFSSHPETTLYVHIITNLSNEDLPPERIIENTKSFLHTNDNNEQYGERFAIMNAQRVVSVKHLAIAANITLMKQRNKKQDEKKQEQQQQQVFKRGIALQTIINGAGSTHVGTVLRDYAFISTNDHKYTSSNTMYSIAVLGFNCSSKEMCDCISHIMNKDSDKINGNGSSSCDEYFISKKDRTQEQLQDLCKSYKITMDEINMSSLEDAIITRISTKYFT